MKLIYEVTAFQIVIFFINRIQRYKLYKTVDMVCFFKLSLHWMLFIREHQEYLKRIQSTKEGRVRGRLEQDLDGLVGRMEAKRLQICKIRQHQQKVGA